MMMYELQLSSAGIRYFSLTIESDWNRKLE